MTEKFSWATCPKGMPVLWYRDHELRMTTVAQPSMHSLPLPPFVLPVKLHSASFFLLIGLVALLSLTNFSDFNLLFLFQNYYPNISF
jgi:hypothetical protein